MAVAVSGTETSSIARERLYEKYRSRIVTNPQIDRSLVSFQANRGQAFYRWLKYKEGFSSRFIEYVLDELAISPGVLLDPFAGTGTALFAGRNLGWDTVGIELLPVGFFAAEARLAAEDVRPDKLRRALDQASAITWKDRCDSQYALSHVPITAGAFPEETERAIAGYRAYCARIKDAAIRKLFDLAGISVLETVSYTRKDGQYLRWDHRAKRQRTGSTFDKGPIPDFQSAVRRKLREIYDDVVNGGQTQRDLFSREEPNERLGCIDLRRGSCLEMLPRFKEESVDTVITSPPYCNRYDYTRTYALELVYLGVAAQELKALRQALLSCTVENRAKVAELQVFYAQMNATEAFDTAVQTFERQKALQEALGILEDFASSGKLNNGNIPAMVRNYFLEMAFVIRELARVLRPGGVVVMVNDNVRYAGEEIPVDLILSDFAESFGFRTEHIWALARGKGNSSQQMGAHGRRELRKCVYVWRKRQ